MGSIRSSLTRWGVGRSRGLITLEMAFGSMKNALPGMENSLFPIIYVSKKVGSELIEEGGCSAAPQKTALLCHQVALLAMLPWCVHAHKPLPKTFLSEDRDRTEPNMC